MAYMQQGELDFSFSYEKGRTYVQVDNHDFLYIDEPGENGLAKVILWSTSHPDAEIVFEGLIQLRERAEEEDE